jgi:hypothetical protein
MRGKWTIGAQLSTSQSPDALGLDRAVEVIERVCGIIDLDLLVVGSREAPEIFRGMCAPRRRVDEVFLWYNVLSDIDEMEDFRPCRELAGRAQSWLGRLGGEKRGSMRHFGSSVRTIRRRAARPFDVSENSLAATPSPASSSTRYAFLRPPTGSTRCSRVSATTAVARRKPSTLISTLS